MRSARQAVLDESACTIAEKELSRLPLYGKRQWIVRVELHGSSSTLFRKANGKLELVALPYLLEQIPDAPNWPAGRPFRSKRQATERSKEKHGIPQVTIEFLSPDGRTFSSREAAWEHASVLCTQEEQIRRGLAGNRIAPLHVAKLQFERDGIWVGGHALDEKKVDLCTKAVEDHFETMMRTITARDLTEQLEIGFDVIRPRGRGRYELVLPEFDTGTDFSFLNGDQDEAPWMPIVRTILGNDATLIHKGSFLSFPQAETQNYHQDGVHLDKQSQQACYAVNVFVPLVDLTDSNGPTEFVLGSHILGYEGYRRESVYTPLPTAGTPIIFDYRLGHRGLGNKSKDIRPILYCTYARRGSGFGQDSVNFSNKRYLAIGSPIPKPLSREERLRKRHRQIALKRRKIDFESEALDQRADSCDNQEGNGNIIASQTMVAHDDGSDKALVQVDSDANIPTPIDSFHDKCSSVASQETPNIESKQKKIGTVVDLFEWCHSVVLENSMPPTEGVTWKSLRGQQWQLELTDLALILIKLVKEEACHVKSWIHPGLYEAVFDGRRSSYHKSLTIKAAARDENNRMPPFEIMLTFFIWLPLGERALAFLREFDCFHGNDAEACRKFLRSHVFAPLAAKRVEQCVQENTPCNHKVSYPLLLELYTNIFSLAVDLFWSAKKEFLSAPFVKDRLWLALVQVTIRALYTAQAQIRRTYNKDGEWEGEMEWVRPKTRSSEKGQGRNAVLFDSLDKKDLEEIIVAFFLENGVAFLGAMLRGKEVSAPSHDTVHRIVQGFRGRKEGCCYAS